MQRAALALACLLTLVTLGFGRGGDKLRVVTTIPDLADIAREIGGGAVDVKSLARGTENIHALPIRPSSMVAINRADVFIQVGLGLEHAFAPGLVQSSRNRDIQPGEPGFITVSEGWQPIQVPPQVSRANGVDIHPLGNPHINLDPAAGEHMADRILAGLIRVRPEQAAGFTERHADYVKRVRAARERWKTEYAKLEGTPVIIFHASLNYFLGATGMPLVDTIEPRPGVFPTPADLKRTVDLARKRSAKLVLTAKWSNNKATRYVGEHAHIPVVEIPVMVGGITGADTWIGMHDAILAKLVKALGQGVD